MDINPKKLPALLVIFLGVNVVYYFLFCLYAVLFPEFHSLFGTPIARFVSHYIFGLESLRFSAATGTVWVTMQRWEFLTRPGVVVVIVLLIWVGMRIERWKRRKGAGQTQ